MGMSRLRSYSWLSSGRTWVLGVSEDNTFALCFKKRAGWGHEANSRVRGGCERLEQVGLLMAASCGHVEATRLLVVEFGLDVNAKGKWNYTALYKAAEGGHVDVVNLQVNDLKADKKVRAELCGHVEVVRLLARQTLKSMEAFHFKVSIIFHCQQSIYL